MNEYCLQCGKVHAPMGAAGCPIYTGTTQMDTIIVDLAALRAENERLREQNRLANIDWANSEAENERLMEQVWILSLKIGTPDSPPVGWKEASTKAYQEAIRNAIASGDAVIEKVENSRGVYTKMRSGKLFMVCRDIGGTMPCASVVPLKGLLEKAREGRWNDQAAIAKAEGE